MGPLFFAHIPKTAGTSFRLGAEEYFTNERIVYDYGVKSGVTDQLVHDHLYSDRVDWWRFRQACKSAKVAMVGGHVPIGRFVSLFGVCNTVTFFREPIQRTASEYSHFVRNNGYKGSFREFYSRPVMQNRLSKILRGVDLNAIGFVGLTERYENSLDVLNAHYGTQIPYRENNKGKVALTASHDITPEDQAELERLNRRDLALYERARLLFEARVSLHRAGLPHVHANIQKVDTGHVAGWAWWAGAGDDPVELELYVNDACVGVTQTADLRPGLCRLLPPRGGYVGFRVPVDLHVGDRVQCRVAETGQRFPLVPHVVPEPQAK